MNHHPDDDDLLDLTVSGEVIRLMWDYEVASPLWDQEGKLPEEHEWLTQALGLSADLITDLERWSADASRLVHSHQAVPNSPTQQDLDRRALELVRRLEDELHGRYRVFYQP